MKIFNKGEIIRADCHERAERCLFRTYTVHFRRARRVIPSIPCYYIDKRFTYARSAFRFFFHGTYATPVSFIYFLTEMLSMEMTRNGGLSYSYFIADAVGRR